jgi:exodeoxyribonuclease VII small subunit
MAEMKFEDALKRLEKIVGDLEGGGLSLDEALEKYEEGIRLSKTCARRLEAARKKVEILLKGEDGFVELKEFDEKAAEEPEKPEKAEKPERPQDAKKRKPKQDEGLF